MARSYERALIDAVLAWDKEFGTDGASLGAAIDAYYTARDADPAAVGKEVVHNGRPFRVVDSDREVPATSVNSDLNVYLGVSLVAPPQPDPITAYAEAHDLDPATVRAILDARERGEL